MGETPLSAQNHLCGEMIVDVQQVTQFDRQRCVNGTERSSQEPLDVLV